MPTSKIAISIDSEALKQVDRLVKDKVFPSRSSAIQEAVREKLSRLNHGRLARESLKLDPKQEQELAESGTGDLEEWPKY